MNWAIKFISKSLMAKISHISRGDYDKGGLVKGFYGNIFTQILLNFLNNSIWYFNGLTV